MVNLERTGGLRYKSGDVNPADEISGKSIWAFGSADDAVVDACRVGGMSEDAPAISAAVDSFDAEGYAGRDVHHAKHAYALVALARTENTYVLARIRKGGATDSGADVALTYPPNALVVAQWPLDQSVHGGSGGLLVWSIGWLEHSLNRIGVVDVIRFQVDPQPDPCARRRANRDMAMIVLNDRIAQVGRRCPLRVRTDWAAAALHNWRQRAGAVGFVRVFEIELAAFDERRRNAWFFDCQRPAVQSGFQGGAVVIEQRPDNV